MKLVKRISAIAASTALAATMVVSASAATWQDCVDQAKVSGVQEENVVQLNNFLEAHNDKFTSAQYDEMIADMKALSDKYVAPYASDLFDKTAEELTEDEKIAIGKQWTAADKQNIIDDLVTLGAKYGVKVVVTESTSHVGYDVAAYIEDEGGNPIITPVDEPVSVTGGVATSAKDSPMVAYIGAFAIVLGGASIVLISRKNKDTE